MVWSVDDGLQVHGGDEIISYQSPSELKAVYGGDYLLTLEKQPVDQSKLYFQMCTISKYWPSDSSPPKNCTPAFLDSNRNPVSLTMDDLNSIAFTDEELEVLKRFEDSIEYRLEEIATESSAANVSRLTVAAIHPVALGVVWLPIHLAGAVGGLATGRISIAMLPSILHAGTLVTGLSGLGIVGVNRILELKDSEKVGYVSDM